MKVERAFTTTLDPADALRLASHLLASRGFKPTETSAGAVGMSRTSGAAALTTNPLLQRPQQVRLECVQGQVTATVDAHPFPGKSGELQRQLLTELVVHVQQLLDAQLELNQVAYAWSTAEDELNRTELARRRRNKWVAAAAAVLVVGAAAGAVVTAMHLH